MKNQMKKILLAVAMVVVVAAGLLVYSSGKTTSMGTAKGFGGDVTVTLTLADGKIIGCTRRGQGRDRGRGLHGHRPAARCHRRERQHWRWTGVAGATVTSNAIKEAAAAALTAAGLNPTTTRPLWTTPPSPLRTPRWTPMWSSWARAAPA